jgi:hypothetical protein
VKTGGSGGATSYIGSPEVGDAFAAMSLAALSGIGEAAGGEGGGAGQEGGEGAGADGGGEEGIHRLF